MAPNRHRVLAYLILSTVIWEGCACFGPREMSYQELEQRNRETKEQQDLMFKPGSVLGSWGIGK